MNVGRIICQWCPTKVPDNSYEVLRLFLVMGRVIWVKQEKLNGVFYLSHTAEVYRPYSQEITRNHFVLFVNDKKKANHVMSGLLSHDFRPQPPCTSALC